MALPTPRRWSVSTSGATRTTTAPSCASRSAERSTITTPPSLWIAASSARCGCHTISCWRSRPACARRWCMRCLDDYLKGRRLPLDTVAMLGLDTAARSTTSSTCNGVRLYLLGNGV